MKGFVFTFDAVLGTMSLLYLLLYSFSLQTPVQEFIFDLSVFRAVSDFLIVENSYLVDYTLNYTNLIGRDVCFPSDKICDEHKEWICGKWKKSVLSDEKLEFYPVILCLEGLN